MHRTRTLVLLNDLASNNFLFSIIIFVVENKPCYTLNLFILSFTLSPLSLSLSGFFFFFLSSFSIVNDQYQLAWLIEHASFEKWRLI